MRVLAYGAGVIGCYLTHVPCQAGNDVTLLAGGSRKQNLEANGRTVLHKRLPIRTMPTGKKPYGHCTLFERNTYAGLSAVPTKMQHWYGSLEKKARAWDIGYVKKNFPEMAFVELPGLNYAEYALLHPAELAERMLVFLNEGGDLNEI